MYDAVIGEAAFPDGDGSDPGQPGTIVKNFHRIAAGRRQQYKFIKGDIDDDIFVRDTIKNIGISVIVGAAVLVTVAIGATPYGPVVLGVSIGISIIADLVFEKLMKEFYDTPQITLDDIIALLPEDMKKLQKRGSSLELSDYGYKVQRGAIFEHSGHEDNIFEQPIKKDDVFSEPNRKTPFDE